MNKRQRKKYLNKLISRRREEMEQERIYRQLMQDAIIRAMPVYEPAEPVHAATIKGRINWGMNDETNIHH